MRSSSSRSTTGRAYCTTSPAVNAPRAGVVLALGPVSVLRTSWTSAQGAFPQHLARRGTVPLRDHASLPSLHLVWLRYFTI